MGVVTTTITRPPRMSTLRNFSRAQLLPEAELEGALALRVSVCMITSASSPPVESRTWHEPPPPIAYWLKKGLRYRL